MIESPTLQQTIDDIREREIIRQHLADAVRKGEITEAEAADAFPVYKCEDCNWATSNSTYTICHVCFGVLKPYKMPHLAADAAEGMGL